jgi:hypothetical protein
MRVHDLQQNALRAFPIPSKSLTNSSANISLAGRLRSMQRIAQSGVRGDLDVALNKPLVLRLINIAKRTTCTVLWNQVVCDLVERSRITGLHLCEITACTVS